jgi:formylglycine-generating enzyme required for sulfatase activity
MQDGNLPIQERAAAADALDKLGWLLPDVYRFARIADSGQAPFWIGMCPVTNAQYQRFVQASDFDDPQLWLAFPAFDEHSKPLTKEWGRQGWEWFGKNAKTRQNGQPGKVILPRSWSGPEFSIARRGVPVVAITWYEANAYCRWLARHWDELEEDRSNPGLRPKTIRLPTEAEWLQAAGGDKPDGRYPWDAPGLATTDLNEILLRANVSEAKLGRTTVLGMYPLGRSRSYGLWDMAGNVWEWQANYSDENRNRLVLRGGSWSYFRYLARSALRNYPPPDVDWFNFVCWPSPVNISRPVPCFLHSVRLPPKGGEIF